MGLNLDPEKVRQFNEGWQRMQKQNVHDAKVVGASTVAGIATGAAIGSVIPGAGTGAGAVVGGLIGFGVGTGILIYERLSGKGYQGGR